MLFGLRLNFVFFLLLFLCCQFSISGFSASQLWAIRMDGRRYTALCLLAVESLNWTLVHTYKLWFGSFLHFPIANPFVSTTSLLSAVVVIIIITITIIAHFSFYFLLPFCGIVFLFLFVLIPIFNVSVTLHSFADCCCCLFCHFLVFFGCFALSLFLSHSHSTAVFLSIHLHHHRRRRAIFRYSVRLHASKIVTRNVYIYFHLQIDLLKRTTIHFMAVSKVILNFMKI